MILTVDIGGTNIRCAVVDTESNRLTNMKTWSRTSGSKVEPHQIKQIIREYIKEDLDEELQVEAISIALAGSVDTDGRKVLLSENIGWYDLPLSDLIEGETGYPTVLETDVICGAIGEVYGTRELRDKIVAYISMGTGIGHCITIRGKVLLGDTRSATRLGHLPINHGGPRCYCGKHGCLCQYTAGPSLLERYKERKSLHERDSVNTPNEMIRLADAADETAQQVLEEALTTLSRGLACLATVINPSVILFGGGMASSVWPDFDQLVMTVKNQMTDDLLPQIRYGEFPATANLIGAAHVGLATLQNRREELYL